MTAINNELARHEIEELLPWYATGTLSGRDAERVEQALAGDRELAGSPGACRDHPPKRGARRTVSARHGKVIRSNQRGGGACAAPSASADQWGALSGARAQQCWWESQLH